MKKLIDPPSVVYVPIDNDDGQLVIKSQWEYRPDERWPYWVRYERSSRLLRVRREIKQDLDQSQTPTKQDCIFRVTRDGGQLGLLAVGDYKRLLADVFRQDTLLCKEVESVIEEIVSENKKNNHLNL